MFLYNCIKSQVLYICVSFNEKNVIKIKIVKKINDDGMLL